LHALPQIASLKVQPIKVKKCIVFRTAGKVEHQTVKHQNRMMKSNSS